MNYQKILTYIWIFLFCFAILGMISTIPFERYQDAYMKERAKYRSTPQHHIDATERYVEAIEEGLEDTSKGIFGRAPKKYYIPFIEKKHAKTTSNKTQKRVHKYQKPLFIRDKSNPNILYKYRK